MHNILLLIGGLRGWQVALIVLVFVLLFGAKRIPAMMRNLGGGLRYFKQGMEEAKREMRRSVDELDEEAPAKDRPSSSAPRNEEYKAKDRD